MANIIFPAKYPLVSGYDVSRLLKTTTGTMEKLVWFVFFQIHTLKQTALTMDGRDFSQNKYPNQSVASLLLLSV